MLLIPNRQITHLLTYWATREVSDFSGILGVLADLLSVPLFITVFASTFDKLLFGIIFVFVFIFFFDVF